MAVDLDNILTRQIGPLPAYGWLMIAGGTGYVLYHMGFGRTLTGGSSSGGQNTGQGTTFNSGQTTSKTTTDPTTGAQTTQTNTFSAQGDGYLPGMMTYGAGPMSYSAGDVYVNYPAQQSPPPAPKNATPTKDYVTTGAAATSDGTADNNANGLATIVYGLISNDSKDAIMGASQIIAANPQVDWAKPVPAGTTIHIPLRWIYQGFKKKNTAYNQGDTSTTSPTPSG